MSEPLGPKPVIKDILAFKGVKWSTLFSIAVSNVDLVLATGTITAVIKKSYDTAVLMSFTQEVVDATHSNLIIPAAQTALSAGRSVDDPAGKYVYSVKWTSASLEFVAMMGDLTMGPT